MADEIKTVTLGVRLTVRERRALEKLAVQADRTASDVVRLLLRKRLREAGVAL